MRFTNEAIRKRKKRAEVISKIFEVLIYCILVPIILYNIMLIVQSANDSNKTPSVFGYKTYVIISGSMTPYLEIGDIVLVKEIEQSELNTGDIISFRSGNSVITHRITNVEQDAKGNILYETKGDSNNSTDSNKVNFNEIEGKYIQKIPWLGNLALLLKNKIVLIWIILIFYMVYMHNSKVEQRRLMRKEKRRVLKDKYE